MRSTKGVETDGGRGDRDDVKLGNAGEVDRLSDRFVNLDIIEADELM